MNLSLVDLLLPLRFRASHFPPGLLFTRMISTFSPCRTVRSFFAPCQSSLTRAMWITSIGPFSYAHKHNYEHANICRNQAKKHIEAHLRHPIFSFNIYKRVTLNLFLYSFSHFCFSFSSFLSSSVFLVSFNTFLSAGTGLQHTEIVEIKGTRITFFLQWNPKR